MWYKLSQMAKRLRSDINDRFGRALMEARKAANSGNAAYKLDKNSKFGYNTGTKCGEINGDQNSKDSRILEGQNGVRRTDRSRNGVWPQGNDPEEVYARLENSQTHVGMVKGTRAGSSGILGSGRYGKSSVLRPAQSVLRDVRGIKVNASDTAGRNVPGNIRARFADTVFKDKEGRLLSLYHWTDARFRHFRVGDVIDNSPITMEVGKAYQAMAQKRLGDESRPHKLSVDDMVSILRGMNDPQYIVYQGKNGRYVEVVPYQLEDKKKAFAVIEIGNDKDAVYMNGYEGNLYNILLTAFQPDVGKLQELLKGKENVVIFDKQKDESQRTSGSMVPSVLNDSPFYDSIIPQTDPDVNSEFSFASDEDLRKQAIKMFQDGVSAKQVYEETGFFIDDKSRIRNDIDDVDGKDYPARKPYPIARPSEALTKAREQIKAEREQHKKELEYNREYWQAETRKAKADVRHEYADMDSSGVRAVSYTRKTRKEERNLFVVKNIPKQKRNSVAGITYYGVLLLPRMSREKQNATC